MRIALLLITWICFVSGASGLSNCRGEESVDTLRKLLTFYASFDDGPDADLARGDRRIHTAESFDALSKNEPGFLTKQQTLLVSGEGISGGGALRFTQRDSPVIFFLADKNLAYQSRDWTGTVSVWMRVDPKQLAPGYCDPVQITTRAWNDGAFFVDFNKDGDPRDFRLGVFSDLAHWNPDNRPLETLPAAQIPMIPVHGPPFAGDRWTHVAFTWEHLNTGQPNGTVAFYMNGQLQGTMTGQELNFTWKPDEVARFFLGIYYVGMMDDVACFERALSAEEIALVHGLQGQLKPSRVE